MTISNINGVDYVYILDIVEEVGCSVQSIRYLTSHGNVVRKMKHIKDRGRILVPLAELKGFPFVKRGHARSDNETYHYRQDENGKWYKHKCMDCTLTMQGCEERRIADAL